MRRRVLMVWARIRRMAHYAIRLPANRVLQDGIGYLLTRPAGRPPHEVRRCFASSVYSDSPVKFERPVISTKTGDWQLDVWFKRVS